MTGHEYDITGICIYCDTCIDVECCEPEPCDRSILKWLGKSRTELLEGIAAGAL